MVSVKGNIIEMFCIFYAPIRLWWGLNKKKTWNIASDFNLKIHYLILYVSAHDLEKPG